MDRIYILQYQASDYEIGGSDHNTIVGCFTDLHLALNEAESILTDYRNDKFIKDHKITSIEVSWWSINTTTKRDGYYERYADNDYIASVTRELIDEVDLENGEQLPVYVCKINWCSAEETDKKLRELRLLL